MKSLILTQSDIHSVVKMSAVVPAIEAAFEAHGRGETQMPVKVYLDLPEYHGDSSGPCPPTWTDRRG